MALDVRYCNPDLSSGSDDGSSEANAFQSVSDAVSYINSNGPGVHMYFKRTSSRDSSTINISATFADTTKKTILEGYETTPGDRGKFQIGSNSSGQIILGTAADNMILRNFDIEFAGAGGVSNCVLFSRGMTNVIENCKVHNLSTNADRTAIRYTQECTIINNEISSAAASFSSDVLFAVVAGAALRGGSVCYNIIKGARALPTLPSFLDIFVLEMLLCQTPLTVLI